MRIKAENNLKGQIWLEIEHIVFYQITNCITVKISNKVWGQVVNEVRNQVRFPIYDKVNQDYFYNLSFEQKNQR
jgi:hypothetical protein